MRRSRIFFRTMAEESADCIGAAATLAMFGAVFSAAAGTHALTPIFPELKQLLRVDDAAARQLTSIFTIGYSISGFLLGVLCDRIGKRRVLLASLSAYALANALLLWVSTYSEFLAARLVAGLGTGGILAGVIATIAEGVVYERRGRVMSLVLAGSYAAMVIGVPLSSYLAQFRPTGIFAVLSLLAAVAAVSLWRLIPLIPPPPARHSPFRLPAQAIRQEGALALLVTTGLNTLAAFAVLSSFADHVVDSFGATLDDRTTFFFVIGIAALPGAWMAAALADRYGKRNSVMLALAGSLLITPTLLLPDRYILFFIPAIAVSIVQALRQGPFAAVLTELASPDLRGSLIGWNSAFSGVGLALGTWLGGIVYSEYGLMGAVGVATLSLGVSLPIFAYWVPDIDRRRLAVETESA